MRYILFLAATAAFTAGCTDAKVAQIWAMGSKHKITCYSGTAVIYQGESTGNVSNQQNSDGWYWEDAKTHLLVECSGTCLIEQE